MSVLRGVLLHLYCLLLHLYPASYRKEFGSEQAEVFDQALQEAIQESRWQFFAWLLLELRDLPVAVLRVRVHREEPIMLRQFFPKTSDRTPWSIALLSLAPLFIMGPLMIILGYLPAWRSIASSPMSSRYTSLLLALMLILGLILGAVRKFPRWSYPYSIFGALMLMIIGYYAINGISWEIHKDGYTLHILAGSVILLTSLVPFLKPFQTNLRQDWTQLSYGLASITPLIVSLHDSDVVPTLSLPVLLPSLVCLAGMLAYLRLASSLHRFEVLLASVLLSILLWALPIFDGISMVGFPGGIYFLRFLLAAWGILLALMIAPILIGIYNWMNARNEHGASSPTTWS